MVKVHDGFAWFYNWWDFYHKKDEESEYLHRGKYLGKLKSFWYYIYDHRIFLGINVRSPEEFLTT